MIRRFRPAIVALEDRTVPAILTVTTGSDNGSNTSPIAGSLRAALIAANATAAIDDILFAIPGAGVRVVSVASALPQLTFPVRVNGYSQTGASRNTLATGDNAQIAILIDAAGNSTFKSAVNGNITGSVFEGLSIIRGAPAFEFAGGVVNAVTIRGNFIGVRPDGTSSDDAATAITFNPLANVPATSVLIGGPTAADRNLFAGITGARLLLDGIGTGLVVQNNFFGVAPNGTTSLPNGGDAIRLLSGTGGTIADNVIGGAVRGVVIGAVATETTVRGNKIGTDATGTLALPNGTGVVVQGKDTRIGGADAGAGNIIAFNTVAGINVTASTTGVTISRNSIFATVGKGIDLNGGTGNHGEVSPVVTAAGRSAAGMVVAGILRGSIPNRLYTVELFGNPTGSGQGRVFLGFVPVQTDGRGNGSFIVTVASPPAGFDAITATATNPLTKETSEFSAPFTATATPPAIQTAGPGGPPALVGVRPIAVGADDGSGAVRVLNPDGSEQFAATPFPGFAGGIRTATADFNGDGIVDLVAGTGPGRPTRVVILDGADRRELFAFDPFEAAFTGGVFVAAGDVTGDGIPDLIITPDQGGGPRVRILTGAGFTVIADFLGIEDPKFRGGARVAVGDINGDGIADLIVAAGFGGGPRIAGFDGRFLTTDRTKLFGDFLAFETDLRNGTYVAVGDLNGDGKAELIAGGGPGGGPRVSSFAASSLVAGQDPKRELDFFAGDPAGRGGVRVAVKDLDGDPLADLVTAAGAGPAGRMTTYAGKDLVADIKPLVALDAFPGFAGGVFVG